MTARPAISISDALSSKRLFQPFFAGPSWNTWRAVLKAAFAEKLNANELETFRTVAARDPPAHRVRELVCAIGRGGGKDSTASFVAAYIAMSFDPKAARLRPGEFAYVMCLAVDRDQAAIVFRYIAAFFEAVPTLKAMTKNIGSDSIELRNKVIIQVVTNSYRSIRGRSVLAAIFDEVAFWRDERAANPDTEVHSAIAPGLARVGGSMLILISSTHRRSGLLYERWKQFHGRDDDDVLVVRGTTRQFNPGFDQNIVDKSLALDPQRYAAEYNSEWRDDLANFLSRDILDATVEPGVLVRPPLDGMTYHGFADPASGSGGDAFTLSIAHREQHNGSERIVIDLIFEKRPKFNPSEVIEEIAALLRTYRLKSVTGDKYAAGFVIEAFRNCKIDYRHSRLDRSECYLGFLPIVTAGQLQMLDHPRAIAQFAGLVRRTFPSGKDRVDHELNGHDDIANSIAGAAVLASTSGKGQKVPIVGPILMGRPLPSDIPGQQSSTALFYQHKGRTYWGPT